METFSATHAAFTGFRLIQGRPHIVLWWALLMFVQSIVNGSVMVVLAGPALAQMESASLEQDPAVAAGLMAQVAPGLLVATVLSLIVYSIFYAATYRAVLRPQDDRAGYLRFGGDELRQFGAALLVGLVIFGVYAGIVLIGAVLISLVSMGNKDAAMVALAPLIAAAVIAVLFCAVRLSLTNVAAFDNGRISLGASWRLTRGRFWSILGAYILAAVFAVIVYLLGLIIFSALAAILGGGLGAVRSAFNPDTASLAGYFKPLTVAYLAFCALLWPLGATLVFGPAATIYEALVPQSRR